MVERNPWRRVRLAILAVLVVFGAGTLGFSVIFQVGVLQGQAQLFEQVARRQHQDHVEQAGVRVQHGQNRGDAQDQDLRMNPGR